MGPQCRILIVRSCTLCTLQLKDAFPGAEAIQRRFWKDVGIERRGNDVTVTLDQRALKTPGGQTLLLPANKILAAALIAAEWDHQETVLKPHALPMVCPLHSLSYLVLIDNSDVYRFKGH